ncbi:MAG TPA: YXWGXW repeat-containing protein, partial [Xanthomonadaceae bacterium]|nr:YXWGXW repeat-containing protein [Xanthomonadaceae bacterium]
MPRSLKRNLLACAASALLATSAFVLAPPAQAGVFLSVRIAPPILPVYVQPELPGPGYIWTPGYWSYDDEINDYYWVPGTWVRPPFVGGLWTPGYWGWNEGLYVFHPGYWGTHVGYYGGINYGFGYIGIGYAGGYWNHGGFYYNSAYNRFGGGLHIHTYDRRVAGDVAVNRFSFNGPGGWDRRPTPEEMRYDHERHTPPSSEQVEHMDRARHDESLRASVNHGTPALAATAHAGAFDHGHETAGHDAGMGAHGEDHHDTHGQD